MLALVLWSPSRQCIHRRIGDGRSRSHLWTAAAVVGPVEMCAGTANIRSRGKVVSTRCQQTSPDDDGQPTPCRGRKRRVTCLYSARGGDPRVPDLRSIFCAQKLRPAFVSATVLATPSRAADVLACVTASSPSLPRMDIARTYARAVGALLPAHAWNLPAG
jgi:hypothetical protein